jgi:transcriptional regulator of acetoin/glycerol metabolism
MKTLAEVEKEMILETVQACNGNIVHAAKMLGIGKTTLYRKLEMYSPKEKSPRE